jgi:hypothetical protein
VSDPTHRCPTCGAEVTVFDGDERTSFYIPVKPGADGDATNMAVSIKFALRVLGRPEDEPDSRRAAALGALRGAIEHHHRRIDG